MMTARGATVASPWFYRFSLLATVLALGVVVLGAYVRLSDAGLGCPDWPGCYGHLTVPESPAAQQAAQAAYPHRPLEAAKGWKEMIHRYFAGALGLLILGLAIAAWRKRKISGYPLVIPLLLLGLVVFQALLGMWTVTWQLKPVVVLAHLLGGLTIVSLLWWQVLRMRRSGESSSGLVPKFWLKAALALGLVLVVAQIALGGWTSSNYAALACNQFPACHDGQIWPNADFSEGFVLWRGLGINYEYGVLEAPARVAIHLVHRLGAVIVAVFTLGLALALWRWVPGRVATWSAVVLALLVTAQFVLGVSNVLFILPLPVAVAHNAGAALLLLTFVTLNHLIRPVRAS
ncbi:COX15/CtaA family protein [Nitrococcus mobilis]|uniref:Cytochrome oxidase assembly n=1 Tax=Nitrococcus mobilis Nb-231 TaxID=314278 RepID=A4BQR6_9GAMM|nr:COX15/CtaA family protein [Nitrococcus mobilis]EAR21916.1 Cytochrome oxidase assembly [Nitrococcus mobilis Nb-231]